MKSNILKRSIFYIVCSSLGLVILFTSASLVNPARISMRMEAKSLIKGKAMVVNAEIFYQYDLGKMITRNLTPLEYFFNTNQKWEANG